MVHAHGHIHIPSSNAQRIIFKETCCGDLSTEPAGCEPIRSRISPNEVVKVINALNESTSGIYPCFLLFAILGTLLVGVLCAALGFKEGGQVLLFIYMFIVVMVACYVSMTIKERAREITGKANLQFREKGLLWKVPGNYPKWVELHILKIPSQPQIGYYQPPQGLGNQALLNNL